MRVDPSVLAHNLDVVHNRIADAGGDPNSVRVVAITKKFDAEVIPALVSLGVAEVGENYAQEARAKYEELEAAAAEQPRWHFVGQLQKNKVRLLASFVDLWQSVDSTGLVDELAKRVPGSRILVQVDLSNEPGRGGCRFEEVPSIVNHARANGIGVEGLMAVAPNEEPEAARPGFRQLAQTAQELGLKELSMGMSADLEVAVREGATMLRLGTAIIGPRA